LNWFDGLKGDNFLAVIDVMLDIKKELDILAENIIFPIMKTEIIFKDLIPIDSPEMRDQYCRLRWNAINFLKKKEIIKGFNLQQNGHRWKSLVEVKLDEKIFNKEYARILEHYKKKLEQKMDIETKKKLRFQFLHKLYEYFEDNPYILHTVEEIGEELGLSKDLSWRIGNYLDKVGLIEILATDGASKIEPEGIHEVENALSKPEESTEHFPPVKNITINIEKMVDSQLQVDSPRATQIKTSKKEIIKKIREFNQYIKDNLEELKVSEDDKAEILSGIKTIDAQVESPNPIKSILKECLSSIKRIMECAIGQVIAMQILDKLPFIEIIINNL
jgi:hypothetical protein